MLLLALVRNGGRSTDDATAHSEPPPAGVEIEQPGPPGQTIGPGGLCTLPCPPSSPCRQRGWRAIFTRPRTRRVLIVVGGECGGRFSELTCGVAVTTVEDLAALDRGRSAGAAHRSVMSRLGPVDLVQG